VVRDRLSEDRLWDRSSRLMQCAPEGPLSRKSPEQRPDQLVAITARNLGYCGSHATASGWVGTPESSNMAVAFA
jgi:hypothetical protein